jgi:hypothetical protein
MVAGETPLNDEMPNRRPITLQQEKDPPASKFFRVTNQSLLTIVLKRKGSQGLIKPINTRYSLEIPCIPVVEDQDENLLEQFVPV